MLSENSGRSEYNLVFGAACVQIRSLSQTYTRVFMFQYIYIRDTGTGAMSVWGQ